MTHHSGGRAESAPPESQDHLEVRTTRKFASPKVPPLVLYSKALPTVTCCTVDNSFQFITQVLPAGSQAKTGTQCGLHK